MGRIARSAILTGRDPHGHCNNIFAKAKNYKKKSLLNSGHLKSLRSGSYGGCLGHGLSVVMAA